MSQKNAKYLTFIFSEGSGEEAYNARTEDSVCDEGERSLDDDQPSILY